MYMRMTHRIDSVTDLRKNWVILDPIVGGEKKLDRNILTGHHGIMAC